jgi:hypothetical protein
LPIIGVYFNAKMGLWVAQIKLVGERKYLGTFREEKDAALAYDR